MKPAVPPTVSMDGPGPGDRSSSSRGDAQKGAYDKSKQIKLTLKSSTSAKPVSRSVRDHQINILRLGAILKRRPQNL